MTNLRKRLDYLTRFRRCRIIPACPESEAQWQIVQVGGNEGVVIGEIYVHPFNETEEIEGQLWFRLSTKIVDWIKRCLRARVYVNMIFMTRERVRAFTIKDLKYLDRIIFKGQYLIREKSVPPMPFSTKFLKDDMRKKKRRYRESKI